MTREYGRAFYDVQEGGSASSASVIAPLLIELLEPESVVDVGCGRGTFAVAFLERGVPDVLGIDGEHAREGVKLQGPRFLAWDLCKPLVIGRRYDLVVCLEVAEHLPEERAATFVSELCASAQAVFFSSAVPGQGGTHHVNEQWQSYWAALFREHDFEWIDYIGARTWHNPSVDFWYAQNSGLYVSSSLLKRSDRLREAALRHGAGPMDVVHPAMFLQYRAAIPGVVLGLIHLSRFLPASVQRGIRKLAGRSAGARRAP